MEEISLCHVSVGTCESREEGREQSGFFRREHKDLIWLAAKGLISMDASRHEMLCTLWFSHLGCGSCVCNHSIYPDGGKVTQIMVCNRMLSDTYWVLTLCKTVSFLYAHINSFNYHCCGRELDRHVQSKVDRPATEGHQRKSPGCLATGKPGKTGTSPSRVISLLEYHQSCTLDPLTFDILDTWFGPSLAFSSPATLLVM